MVPSEIHGVNYSDPGIPLAFPANFGLMQSNSHAFQFSRLTNLPTYQTILPGVQELIPYSACISNNSTSDEAEDHQLRIIDDRKQRRMISNRESARRSRMRKQRHLDELWSHVLRLKTENHHLLDKLNHVSESYDRVIQENVRIKEEASDLRQMLTEIHISNSYSILRDLEDVSCDTAHPMSQSPSQTPTTSTNLPRSACALLL